MGRPLQFTHVQRPLQPAGRCHAPCATAHGGERGIPAELLLRIIDTGQVRHSDEVRLWAWLEVPGRDDNLICVALVLEDAVVVKTVMHHWEVTP